MEKYQQLMDQLAEAVAENTELKRRTNLLEATNRKQEKTLKRERVESKILQTLSLELVNNLRPNELYKIICESLVEESGWDASFVIKISGGRATILAQEGADEKTINHLTDYLSDSSVFRKTYLASNAFSTHTAIDKESLAIRSLFSAKEVILLPIMHMQVVYAYLAVSSKQNFDEVQEDSAMRYMTNLALHLGSILRSGASYKQLKDQNLKLKQLDELKDSFISITSHQLRTPLSIVKWILSVLSTDKDVKKLKKVKELIGQAYESNERLIHVVNDLLNVSRIQEGRLPYNPLPTELGELIGDTHQNSQAICESKKLTFDYEVEENLPKLLLDPILFKEALQNMIYNAIDYNKEGGNIQIKAYQHNFKAYISISNSGIGISADDQKRIFEQFYRAEEAIQMQPTGSGLGLYLSQAVINQHGGEIICESKLKGNTTFTVILPIPEV